MVSKREGANMIEYKILRDHPEECQKILNQWRHLYSLQILGFSAFDTIVVILLTRTLITEK